MKILVAASECVPFVKVGGLADVCGALGKYLKIAGQDVRIILPLYKKIDREKFNIKKIVGNFLIPLSNKYVETSIAETKIDNLVVYFVINEKYFNRDEVYGTSEGDYSDQHERFIFFSKAVMEATKFVDFKPDIIHCHDWQTGLIPAYLKTVYKIDAFYTNTKSIYTIHNIAYQGFFGKNVFYLAGFSDMDFTADKLEYYGKFNFMKSGIRYADKVTTVSPTYAKEIQASKEYGRGMEGILKARGNDVLGILNGIDYDYWNSETDKFIKTNFSVKDISKKLDCKKSLVTKLGLSYSRTTPLIGMISRIDPQKGFDMIIDSADKLLSKNIQLVILGKGDKEYQDKLVEISKKYAKKIAVRIEFNDQVAHEIYAGCDMFLMPSRFEPCGLGQMIAMRYGTVPIVTQTGGLKDSVDKTCGFLIEKQDSISMLDAIDTAVATFKNKDKWQKIVKKCLSSDFSWDKKIDDYINLYEGVTAPVLS